MGSSANLGLGMLFFFAGYEIDCERIAGAPLRLGAVGWLLSLAIAYAHRRAARGRRDRALAASTPARRMATTAIGTLIPILSDTGELRTRFGTYLLGRRSGRASSARSC